MPVVSVLSSLEDRICEARLFTGAKPLFCFGSGVWPASIARHSRRLPRVSTCVPRGHRGSGRSRNPGWLFTALGGAAAAQEEGLCLTCCWMTKAMSPACPAGHCGPLVCPRRVVSRCSYSAGEATSAGSSLTQEPESMHLSVLPALSQSLPGSPDHRTLQSSKALGSPQPAKGGRPWFRSEKPHGLRASPRG